MPCRAWHTKSKSIIGRGVRHHSGTALNKANAIMGYGVRSNQPSVCAICLNNLFYQLYRASASRWISTLDSSVTVWRRRIRMRFRMVLLIKCCLGSQAAASSTLSSLNKPEQCVVCKKRERVREREREKEMIKIEESCWPNVTHAFCRRTRKHLQLYSDPL